MGTNTNIEEASAPSVNEESKKIAVIAYFTIVGLIIALVMNNDKKLSFATYHIRQSIGLCATGFGLFILGFIPVLGWIINVLGFFVLVYMWISALLNSINEKEIPAPILGRKFVEWFKAIQ